MRNVSIVLLVGVLIAGGPAISIAQRCGNTSVGFTPINDLGAQFYRGWQGGLYPGGENESPAEHQIAGEDLAGQIQPLNQSGQPDPVSGKIVLLSIGMSNTWQEFVAFKELVASMENRNPALVVINGAQPGFDINRILSGDDEYWSSILDSLATDGVSDLQVQAIWFKQAEAFPMLEGNDTTFHAYVDTLKAKFITAIQIARSKFPNAKVCYMASRTYGGYAGVMLNPEPFAYYTGWSSKRLIEDQINGLGALSYAEPNPVAPWLSWGVYLWADGLTPRNDGLIWECDDFQGDGTHPSEVGELKVATALLGFFSTDATTRPWFLESPNSVTADESSVPVSYSLSNYPNPFNPVTYIRFTLPVQDHVRITVLDITGRVVREILNERLPAGIHEVPFDARVLGSGTYLYRLWSPNTVLTGKMLLVR